MDGWRTSPHVLASGKIWRFPPIFSCKYYIVVVVPGKVDIFRHHIKIIYTYQGSTVQGFPGILVLIGSWNLRLPQLSTAAPCTPPTSDITLKFVICRTFHVGCIRDDQEERIGACGGLCGVVQEEPHAAQHLITKTREFDGCGFQE